MAGYWKHIMFFSHWTHYARTLKVLGHWLQDKGYPRGSFPWACFQKKKKNKKNFFKHSEITQVKVVLEPERSDVFLTRSYVQVTDISCGGCVPSNLSKPCTVPKLPLRVSSCFCPVWYEIAIFSSHQKTMKGFYLQYFLTLSAYSIKREKPVFIITVWFVHSI